MARRSEVGGDATGRGRPGKCWGEIRSERELSRRQEATKEMLMGGTLADLPAGLVSSPLFFARTFLMYGAVRMQKSGVTQGPESHLFFWSNVRLCGWRWVGQVECGAAKPVIISARPMPPAVPRAPWASPVAGSGLAPFRHFFFCSLRGTRVQGPKQGFSTLRADAGEYGAGKVRFRAPQWALRMAP